MLEVLLAHHPAVGHTEPTRWYRAIAFHDMKDVEVTFPAIEDASMAVAHKYGMIMAGEDPTMAARSVLIGPKGVIRTVIYHPGLLATRRSGHRFDRRLLRRGR